MNENGDLEKLQQQSVLKVERDIIIVDCDYGTIGLNYQLVKQQARVVTVKVQIRNTSLDRQLRALVMLLRWDRRQLTRLLMVSILWLLVRHPPLWDMEPMPVVITPQP